MNPQLFPQANRKLVAKKGGNVGHLPIYSDGKACVSCWTGSWSERIKFLITGELWLTVKSGKSQPPVFLSTEPPAFKVRIPETTSKRARKANVVALLAILALSACSKPEPESVYRIVSVGWTNGAISQPTLYRKDGDPDHLYMRDLGDNNWIRLQK